MKYTFCSLVLIFVLTLGTLSTCQPTLALVTTKTLYISNLSETGATQAKPGFYTGKYHAVQGVMFNNILYVNVDDLNQYLGVTYFTSTQGGNTLLSIQGNSSPRTTWSTAGTFDVWQYYSVILDVSVETNGGYRRTNGTVLSYTSYSYSKSGDIDATYVYYNNGYYVPARATALSLGSLLYYSSTSYDAIFDYRVNTSGYYVDNNSYLTGGNWLTNWNSQGTSYVAPNFSINELWSKNSGDSAYLYQFKMSISQLHAAQLVRKFYRNNSSLGIDPGFRGWRQNYDTPGANKLSWHTRGRAWDSDGIPSSVQDAVLVDFGVNDNWTYSPFNDSTVAIVRSRKNTYKEISLGDEMETGVTWLHIQTDPTSSQTSHIELP